MTFAALAATLKNAVPVRLAEIPRVEISLFRDLVLGEVEDGARIAAFFGVPRGPGEATLFAVLANDTAGVLRASSSDVEGSYPALTPECTQAHWFEREIAEDLGATPEGHPWPKPIRFTRSELPGVTDHYRVEGHEVHEVAVGPVHAGVIEPGHFRFQCHGETVFHLEISLGYQHRGVERAIPGGPDARTIHYMETAAGDTSIGHALAYCHAVEGLAGAAASPRAQAIRGVALELERLANHTGDLGALANDVGYLPTASYCGRLRGDFLSLTALLCGSRFGRGLVRPGRVGFDLDPERATETKERLAAAAKDVANAAQLLFKTSSVRARFENTGTLLRQTAHELGLVGPAARASGLERDVRREFPTGIFRFAQVPVSTYHTGDVFARAHVRWMEIQRSIEFVGTHLSGLPGGEVRVAVGPLAPDSFVASLIEGWRGEICHVAITGPDGHFARYKIVDPSFHNWFGLAMAMRGQEISDFPLTNKSFNLSYCGHDL